MKDQDLSEGTLSLGSLILVAAGVVVLVALLGWR
jgi:hypothetical protein